PAERSGGLVRRTLERAIGNRAFPTIAHAATSRSAVGKASAQLPFRRAKRSVQRTRGPADGAAARSARTTPIAAHPFTGAATIQAVLRRIAALDWSAAHACARRGRSCRSGRRRRDGRGHRVGLARLAGWLCFVNGGVPSSVGYRWAAISQE